MENRSCPSTVSVTCAYTVLKFLGSILIELTHTAGAGGLTSAQLNPPLSVRSNLPALAIIITPSLLGAIARSPMSLRVSHTEPSVISVGRGSQESPPSL